MAPLTEAEAETEVYESVVLPMSLRVTIVELKEAMCRWPLGDPTSPDFRYCGSPASGGPYCAHHGRMAYQPAQDRRRERDRQRRLALRLRAVGPGRRIPPARALRSPSKDGRPGGLPMQRAL